MEEGGGGRGEREGGRCADVEGWVDGCDGNLRAKAQPPRPNPLGRCVLLLRPLGDEGLRLYIQQVGRALRVAPGNVHTPHTPHTHATHTHTPHTHATHTPRTPHAHHAAAPPHAALTLISTPTPATAAL